jgi:hypothetical protein
MATPIVVNPTQPSQVVVNGTQKSGTPIKVTTDLDYNRVQSMIDEAVGDIDFSALAKEETLTQGISSVESKMNEESAAIQGKIDGLSTTFDDIYAQQLASIIG